MSDFPVFPSWQVAEVDNWPFQTRSIAPLFPLFPFFPFIETPSLLEIGNP